MAAFGYAWRWPGYWLEGTTGTPSSGGGVPSNALTFEGQPLTFEGEYLTYA